MCTRGYVLDFERLAQGCVTGFKDVTVNSVEALITGSAQQLVSVGFEADSVFFQLYCGGDM